MMEWALCRLALCQFGKARLIWEGELPLRNCLHGIGLQACLWGIFLMNGFLWEGPVYVWGERGNVTPGQGALGCIGKQTEQASKWHFLMVCIPLGLQVPSLTLLNV